MLRTERDVLTGAVVVGVDGSPGSRAALDWAGQDAALRGRRLVLLAAATPSAGAPAPAYDVTGSPALVEAREYAEARWPDLEVLPLAVGERAAPALIEASSHAAVVVLGSHGHSAVDRFVLGSVTHHVTAHALCPVVVVRGHGSGWRLPVTVGLDDAPAAHEAIGFALEVAATRGVPLVAVRAWEGRPSAVYGAWATDPEVLAGMRAEQERLAHDVLAGWPEKYPEVEVVVRLVRQHPSLAIVAESHRSQLLVVGARGHGEFQGMTFGSVAAAACSRAECPVAVVPARQG